MHRNRENWNEPENGSRMAQREGGCVEGFRVFGVLERDLEREGGNMPFLFGVETSKAETLRERFFSVEERKQIHLRKISDCPFSLFSYLLTK